MNIQLVRKSSNAKTGPIPTTTSPRSTCPTECPLSGKGGCYAEAGYYTRLNWDKVDSGERGTDWPTFLQGIRKLPEGQLWRHNVAGDLPQDSHGLIDERKLWELAAANTGKRGFTYTHYTMDKPQNREAVASANRVGFTINVSHNSPQEALQASHGQPRVTIVPEDFWRTDGRREGTIVRCPAEYTEAVSCATCQLCQRGDRKDIVGFTVHGTRKGAANDVIASVG